MEMRKQVKQGKSSDAQVTLGWLEALEWVAGLPKVMLKAVSKKEE